MMPDITSSQYSLNLWFLFKSFLKMNAGAREKAKRIRMPNNMVPMIQLCGVNFPNNSYASRFPAHIQKARNSQIAGDFDSFSCMYTPHHCNEKTAQ